MEERISATALARRLGDILGRVRYRGESFVVERNGDQIARLVPVPGKATATLRGAFASWRRAGTPDRRFADDLERVGRADRPAKNPWVL
jgi:antitoxin (DNA-binding transcriptional repressor) of toxin-antitoxin stability system